MIKNKIIFISATVLLQITLCASCASYKKNLENEKRQMDIESNQCEEMAAEQVLSRQDFNKPWIVGIWRVTYTAENVRDASLIADIRGSDDCSETIVSFGDTEHTTTLGWLLNLFYKSSFDAFEEAEQMQVTFAEQIANGLLKISFQRPTLSADKQTVTAFFYGEFSEVLVNRTFKMERLYLDNQP
ncbi:MAG: hypothetical protein K6G73_03445 [Marinilabiliaceae bacterium]|nr:hypothetical protein [Marinilabiliaceae bacterium]